MELIRTEITTVKIMRLVSKDTLCLAMRALSSLAVHLGDGSNSPDPQQLVKLTEGHALENLGTFSVTLGITSGEGDWTQPKRQS